MLSLKAVDDAMVDLVITGKGRSMSALNRRNVKAASGFRRYEGL